ncbi:unnamed protein product [Prunus armeniaca]|uniref:Uncharacterized protein n=1 Tax=Prunus armeniaca TaxID=36596 RepID=A0A6J5TF87_PRUAR|nr:unnamed protein product [Prunus armeniaca]
MRRSSTYESIQVHIDRVKGFSQDQPPAQTVTLMLRPKENDNPKLQRKITEDEEMKKNKERVRDGSSSNRRNNIFQNTIRGTNGAADVGVLNFGNVVVQGQGGGKGMKGFPEHGRGFNIYDNTVTADGVGTSKIGFQNFGNTRYEKERDSNCAQKKRKSEALLLNMSARVKGIHNNEGAGSSRNDYPDNKITKTNDSTDVGIFTHGSSDTVWTNARGGEGKKPKGVGKDISGNKIKGDGAPDGFRNFSNTNKTTNEEDYCVTSDIHKNSITAGNGAECVGMDNFHNTTNLLRNASQGQGAIGHNIYSNNISADGSEKAGFNNFGNTNTQYSETT